MRRLAVFVLLPVALAQLGCGITGTWRFDHIWPTTADARFRIHELTLRDDGSARIAYRGDEVAEGTYRFGDGKLVLESKGLRLRETADATLTSFDLSLRLGFYSREGMVEVTFRRVPEPNDDAN